MNARKLVPVFMPLAGSSYAKQVLRDKLYLRDAQIDVVLPPGGEVSLPPGPQKDFSRHGNGCQQIRVNVQSLASIISASKDGELAIPVSTSTILSSLVINAPFDELVRCNNYSIDKAFIN